MPIAFEAECGEDVNTNKIDGGEVVCVERERPEQCGTNPMTPFPMFKSEIGVVHRPKRQQRVERVGAKLLCVKDLERRYRDKSGGSDSNAPILKKDERHAIRSRENRETQQGTQEADDIVMADSVARDPFDAVEPERPHEGEERNNSRLATAQKRKVPVDDSAVHNRNGFVVPNALACEVIKA